MIYPGEKELESLAFGALRVLRGEETARVYPS
jgi:butyrate kinase